MPIDRFVRGGSLEGYRLASFLVRDGVVYDYGIDSDIGGYSYNHERLLDWIIDRMNNQIDEGPLRIAGNCFAHATIPSKHLSL
ncbi:MAG: DUF5718 family protein [Campylobacterales bacterium]